MTSNPGSDFASAANELAAATSELRQWGVRLSAVGLAAAGDRILELVLSAEQQQAAMVRAFDSLCGGISHDNGSATLAVDSGE